MNKDTLKLMDFDKIESLLKGFNKSTGFVTAILDLEGNILSKSGWRQICTEFHRENSETSKKCNISDTELANKMGEGEKYHFYKCLNGLVDVAVPIVINGEHIANLFSGQFFFEEPDSSFFQKQAKKYGFDEEKYLAALKDVPVVSMEKVKTAMDFLLDMTQLISEVSFQKLEQKELNKSIIESEEKFRALYDNAPLSYQSLNEEGSFNDVNPTWLSTLGYKRDEVIGKFFIDFLHPDYKPHFEKNFPAFKERGYVHDVQFKIRHKEGHYLHVSFEGCVGYNPDGSFKQMYCVFQDITERKKAEEVIFELKEFNESIVKNLAEGIILEKDDGIIQFANPAMLKMLGYEEGGLDGKHWTCFVPDDQVEVVKNANKRREQGESDQYEMELVRKDGTRIVVLVGGVPNIHKGVYTGLLAAFTDITERKQAEQALLAKMDELERFQKLTVGRELNMIELKKEVNSLLKKLGMEEKYKIVE